MLALKDVLIIAGVVMLACAVSLALYDLWKVLDYPRKLAKIAATSEEGSKEKLEGEAVRWCAAVAQSTRACISFA